MFIQPWYTVHRKAARRHADFVYLWALTKIEYQTTSTRVIPNLTHHFLYLPPCCVFITVGAQEVAQQKRFLESLCSENILSDFPFHVSNGVWNWMTISAQHLLVEIQVIYPRTFLFRLLDNMKNIWISFNKETVTSVIDCDTSVEKLKKIPRWLLSLLVICSITNICLRQNLKTFHNWLYHVCGLLFVQAENYCAKLCLDLKEFNLFNEVSVVSLAKGSSSLSGVYSYCIGVICKDVFYGPYHQNLCWTRYHWEIVWKMHVDKSKCKGRMKFSYIYGQL